MSSFLVKTPGAHLLKHSTITTDSIVAVAVERLQKLKVLGPDYMANFSPASETNPLKIKLSITWRGIQRPGRNSARAENLM